jgi:hypothetical protein
VNKSQWIKKQVVGAKKKSYSENQRNWKDGGLVFPKVYPNSTQVLSSFYLQEEMIEESGS